MCLTLSEMPAVASLDSRFLIRSLGQPAFHSLGSAIWYQTCLERKNHSASADVRKPLPKANTHSNFLYEILGSKMFGASQRDWSTHVSWFLLQPKIVDVAELVGIYRSDRAP